MEIKLTESESTKEVIIRDGLTYSIVFNNILHLYYITTKCGIYTDLT